jgi:hypothetical protein
VTIVLVATRLQNPLRRTIALHDGGGMKHILLIALAIAGCGGKDAKPVDAGNGQDGAVPGNSMTLTSPAFSEGGTIPTVNTCKGANTSPMLTWTGTPSGTQSFAVVLTDQTISMAHWVIQAHRLAGGTLTGLFTSP